MKQCLVVFVGKAEAHRALEAAEKQSMDVLADANQAKKRLAELQESHGEASQDSEGFTQAHVDELLEAARAAERVSATEAMDEAVSAAREAALGSVRTEVCSLFLCVLVFIASDSCSRCRAHPSPTFHVGFSFFVLDAMYR